MSLLKIITIINEIVSIGSAILITIKNTRKYLISRDHGFWNNKESYVQNINSSRYIELVIDKKLENQLQTGYITYSSNVNLLEIFRLPFVTKKIFPGILILKALKNRELILKSEILAMSISINNSLFLINFNMNKIHSKRIEKLKFQDNHRHFFF